jgi:AcrR family transcriptional regulator
LTARQASDEKAAMLVEAARNVLTRQGYARTTIKEVAAEAGVSRGLLHYYFKNKEEMLFLVVRESIETSSLLAESIFSKGKTRREIAANICLAMRKFMEESPHFIGIIFERWSLARQSQTARDQFESLYKQFRIALLRGLENAAERGVIKPSTSLAQLATVLTAFIDGLSFELMVMPDLSQDKGFWQTSEKALAAILTNA